MTHTLRFPFRLPPGQQIADLAAPDHRVVEGLNWTLDQKGAFYVLEVTGLASESACQEYVHQLWSGFNWLLLKRGVAAEASLKFDKVVYAPDPEEAARNLEKSFGLRNKRPVHGLVNDNMPAAYPSNKNIRFVGFGNSSVVVGTPVEHMFNFLTEGMSVRGAKPTVTDSKLQTGLDLLAAHWTEHSDNARLLTLVLALESLMSDPPRHQVVVRFLDKWKGEVEARKNDFTEDSEERHALESLERELLFKKTDSLRRQVRTLVRESLDYLGHKEAAELAKKAVWVYDKRSKLVHEGVLPQQVLSEAIMNARTIVQLVLEARFRGFASAT